jgi:signal transduction histidine kinase/ActR/RegA family two-component response regulator
MSPTGERPKEKPLDREALLDQLRDANEQLVVGAMRAHELADQAETARADAETANHLKDEFLANVSHELRTPLNAVLGWARLLGGGQLDAARALNAIRTIERNVHALARIIDDLLDASRILGGKIHIEPLPLDLVAIAQGALDQVRFAAEAKGLQIGFSCPSEPEAVAGDALRLQQVVTNLLANAVKFTPSNGSIELVVRAAGSHAEIQVADTGLGIDPAFLPRIFDRFTQADASTTRRHGGLGLGLSIVRGLVERHGGTVHAESPGLGHGATFTVRLPVLPNIAPVNTVAIGDAATTAAAAGRVRLDGLRVVLVEDDFDARQVLTLLLELAGASVTPVGSVHEALGAVDSVQPHVIVSDIGMPGEDGFALMRALRAREGERGSALPAIALTGYVGPDSQARILAAGFQMHLRKPIEPDEVVAAVGRLAAQREG